ncbi:hypothetical protein ACSBR1_042829 [Camellia fascicularis]
MKAMTAESIQELANCLAFLKARASTDSTQIQQPSGDLCSEVPPTPVFQNPRWSDIVEEGTRSKLLDILDSLMVIKTRGISHPHAAIGGQLEKAICPPLVLMGIGMFLRVMIEQLRFTTLTSWMWIFHKFQLKGLMVMLNEEASRFVGGGLLLEVLDGVEECIDKNLVPGQMLLLYLFDLRFPYTLIKNSAFNMWRNKGLLEVNINDKGFTFFIFKNKDCCKDILDGGPWYVGGFLLILKQWHHMMKLSKKDKKTIPVWVKFYNIPMEFWTGDGLSRIASAVGVPLFMDQLTSSGNRISFARACVNIQADSAFPENFFIISEGESVEI